MKAIVLIDIDAPLKIEEVALPEIGPEEVLVELKAAGINKRDWWIWKGKYAGLKFPIILGSDGSGIVKSVGSKIPSSWQGKEVLIYPASNWGDNQAYQAKDFKILGLPENGCYAEYVKVKGDMLFPKPSHLSYVQAAALPVAGLTAYRALFIRGRWQKGDKVLISGAGGGAAAFALQWAVAAGAEVWVTSGNEQKIEKAISLGAKGGINYKNEDWAEQLNKKAGQFDLIIDSALGDGFENLVSLAASGGRIVFFGGTAGNIPALNGRPIFWKQIDILGTTMGSPKDFEQMLHFVEQHQIIPVNDEIIPLEDAEQALTKMNGASASFGKTVLSIGS